LATFPSTEPETNWGGVVFGLALGVLAAFQQFKLPPTLPLLLQKYGYERTLAGGFMSVYAAAGLFLSVPVGRRLARKGPHGLLAAALLALLAGNALALVVASSGLSMLASRLFEGLGYAVLAVLGAVITTSSASPRHRPLAAALWATWIPAGQVSGTVLAIPIVSAGLWRPLWWIAAVATLALGVWAWRLAAAGNPPFGTPVRRPDPAREAAPRPPEGPPRRDRLLLVAAGLFTLWSVQYLSYVTWLPQYLVEAHGFSPGAAARAYLVPSIVVIVFNLAGGALLQAGVRLGTLLVGSIAVQALVWFLVPVTQSAFLGLISLVAYGAAAGITPTCLFMLPGAILGANAARGFAAIMAGRNLGILIGPPLLALVVARAGNWGPVGPLFGAVCVAATTLSGYLSWRLLKAPIG
jgi:predicted MFS family arabinose efflux permease